MYVYTKRASLERECAHGLKPRPAWEWRYGRMKCFHIVHDMVKICLEN